MSVIPHPLELARVRPGDILLPETAAALVREMIEGFVLKKVGRLGRLPRTAGDDVKQTLDFINFTGKPPWDCDENDFDAWTATHLLPAKHRKKGLLPPSQRKYQGGVQRFFDFLVGNIGLQTKVGHLFGGKRVYQVCDEVISHVNDEESPKLRRAMTFDEIEYLFQILDAEIERTKVHHPKRVLLLQRAKADLAVTYGYGLRVDETRRVDITHFREDPDQPDFGRFGMLRVRGKGKKWRTVPVCNPVVPDMIKWYLEEVRPSLPKANPKELAFLLSERGQRISKSSLEDRFIACLELAGLQDEGFVRHSLRRTAATHLWLLGVSIESIRDFLGHRYATTTQIYIGIPPGLCRLEIGRLTESENLEISEESEDVER